MTLIEVIGDLRLRHATKADTDGITEVAIKAFPDDPEFDYRFPYRHKYPEDHHKWVRREYEEYLEQRDKFVVLVVTTSVKLDNDTVSEKVIALAVWDMKVMKPATGGNLGIDTRRDVNRAHFDEFARTVSNAFEKYFSHFGEKQYHLWLLATHPDFRKRGAGSALTRWGMRKATECNYMTTVLGSPMGTALYRYLGFVLVGTATARVDGEEENLPIWCLEYGKIS